MNIFSNITLSRLPQSLTYMWQGMLCIFIVIGVIMASVYAMGAISTASAKRKAERESAEDEQNQ